jgi:hypothetical protein
MRPNAGDVGTNQLRCRWVSRWSNSTGAKKTKSRTEGGNQTGCDGSNVAGSTAVLAKMVPREEAKDGRCLSAFGQGTDGRKKRKRNNQR